MSRTTASDSTRRKKRVTYEHLALADAPGELSFYVRTSVGGVSLPMVIGRNSLLKRSGTDTEYEEIKVKAVRLDDYFSPAAAEKCCIWIDVEGSTGQVITGGHRLLGQAQVLMIEVEDQPVWQNQWLVGQVVEFLYQLGLVPVTRDFEWWPDNYNIVCIRDRLLDRPDIRIALDRFHSSISRKEPVPAGSPSGRLWRRLRALLNAKR